MNCKPGDLAYIVAPYSEYGRGLVVQVLRTAVDREIFEGYSYLLKDGEQAWVCKGNLPSADTVPRSLFVIADECLRPIAGPSVSMNEKRAQEVCA